MKLAVVLVAVAVVLFGKFCITKANVVLMGNNITLSFDDKEATFGEFLSFLLLLFSSCFNLCLVARKISGNKSG